MWAYVLLEQSSRTMEAIREGNTEIEERLKIDNILEANPRVTKQVTVIS